MIETTMNKLTTLLILLALTMPMGALAQPNGDGPPRDRPDRDRSEQRDRGDRDRERGRPGGERDRDGDRPGKREPLSVDQVEEALATLRAMHGDKLPSWMERIEKQAKEDPEAAAKSLSRFPRIREMMEAREHRPEEFALQAKQGQLMREVFPLVRELKQAQRDEDQDKINELKPQIRERIEKLFQVRLELKEIEIQRIREKLARAEKELSEIEADSDSLIDQKMEEILAGKGPRGPREGGDRGEKGERDERRPKPDRPERDE
jgi:hypothetical protein